MWRTPRLILEPLTQLITAGMRLLDYVLEVNLAMCVVIPSLTASQNAMAMTTVGSTISLKRPNQASLSGVMCLASSEYSWFTFEIE
jgi:hypothetical protein